MGMINSERVKNGMCIKLDNRLYYVVEFLHVKPGKGNTIMRTKLKDVVNGRVIDRTFQVGFKLEEVRVERRPYQYLYQEGESYMFMNQETFDQIPIDKIKITGVDFLKEGNCVDVVSDADANEILYAELPVKVVLQISYTEPGVKGDTATNSTKPAKLETGAEIRVPLFVNEGELVEVDTRDGSYVGRVKA
jgi:elongation factor P